MTITDVEVAIAAASAGAEVVLRDYGSHHVRQAKDATDFSTRTDVDAERAILAVLDEHRPGDARTSEESGDAGSTDALRRWLIDPLCGTQNFAATTPLSVVNVALQQHGAAGIAAAADPNAAEVFWTDGNDSFRRFNDEDYLLAPSAVSGLIDINCDGPVDRPFVGSQLLSDPRLRALYGPRVISSTLAVAWVAAGRRAAYISDGHFRANIHFAAGIALCQAAGCTITNLAGRSLLEERGLVISANERTHEQVLELVEPHLASVQRP